ncbi:MAG TPA: nodulation protein NfeD [Stellaceae bacterium]|nr:nodulation protein NfeD [Stellaceae bacterium]
MARGAPKAVILEIDGAIGPAVAEYVAREFRDANPSDTRIVILRMNTPGGLDTSMREIIAAILAAPVPVATYVAPSGARAASAGTYIAYASAVAAMAPGTNIGAATPIQLGGPGEPPRKGREPDTSGDGGRNAGGADNEPPDAEGRKVLNDAIAYIRGLAELNGRNADWAADAVRNAVSIPASEALKLHVIDVVADDVPDLLRQIDGRSVTVAGKTVRLATQGLEIVVHPPDWRTQLLAVITNPNIALLLMLAGVWGLVFELTSPGAVVPGVLGAISLLVALFALNLLPVNFAGVALLALGIGLMIAEAHLGAFGLLGVAGIAAFVIGGVMMFPSRAPGFALSLPVLAGATVVTGGLFLVVLALLLRSRRRPIVTGDEGLLGAEGEAVAWQGEEGRVRIKGEIWRARAARPLEPGNRVRVIERQGLVLTVEPM